MSTTFCSDTTIGSQIWRYELDDLEPTDRERFESHLMVCAVCRSEVAKMLPMIGVLRPSRADLLAQLQTDGVSFDKLRDEIRDTTGNAANEEAFFDSWLSRFIKWRAWTRRRWVVAPAMAVAVAVVIMLILWSPPRSAYLGLLEFNPLLYERYGARGNETLEKSDPFSEGMDAYCAGDYEKAISRLSKAVRRDRTDGTGWLYLGVSYYLHRDARPAVKALRRAASSANPNVQDAGQWYLAQAFLLNNEADSALVRIGGLERGSRWWPKADSMATKLRTWKAKP